MDKMRMESVDMAAQNIDIRREILWLRKRKIK